MNLFKKTISLLAIVSAIFAISSCGSKYNKTKFQDPNEGSEWVYGKDTTQAAK